MPGYDTTVDSTIHLYATQQPEFKSYGLDAFDANGRPIPFGLGTLTVTLNALAVQDPTPFGGDYATSGTIYDLYNAWRVSLVTNNGLQTFSVYDPRADSFITVHGRLNIPKLLQAMQSGGANLPNVTIQIDSAFFPGVSHTGYGGGDPSPITDPPPHIPGDPLPTPDPLLTYGWGIGRWGYGLYGQGEGV